MANSLMSMLGGVAAGGSGKGIQILIKIAGAIIRGESPIEFAQRLAKTEPKLQGLDLTDLDATASKMCRERGIDKAKITEEIKQSVAAAIKQ